MSSSRKQIPLECNQPLELSLGDNKLRFLTTGWTLDSSDIDIATREINDLVDQNKICLQRYEALRNENKVLREELAAANALKMTVMDMIVEEREKNVCLERKVEVYREKLKESYRAILRMK